MRKYIGIAILACIAIGLLIAMIESIGWDGTVIVLSFSGAIVALIFLAVWLIWG